MYNILFSDQSTFQGGTLKNSRWTWIPDKPISEWTYTLFEKPIVLKGYEAYNHLLEKVNVFGSEKVLKVILMGKKGNNVDCIEIDLQNSKISKTVKEFGSEYLNKPTLGWKIGVI